MYRGERVTLTPVHRRHVEPWLAWVNDLEIATLVDRVLPVSDVGHEKWVEGVLARPDVVMFALEANDTGAYIGNVWLWGINPRHSVAELRILIGDKSYWGKGYGTEAIALLVEVAFQRLNLHKVYAYVLESNPRGVAAFQKCGFKREGILKKEWFVNGRYEDVARLGIIRK